MIFREGKLKHNWKVGDEFDVRIRCHDDRFEVLQICSFSEQ